MSKTVLITGGAGFIGSHLCGFFLKKNFKVIAVDNLLTGDYNNIVGYKKKSNFEFIEFDICKKFQINDHIDYILHFASPASPEDYLKYPIKTLQIGSIGTENILKLGLSNNATVLVASTSEIYGDPLVHPQSESYFGNVNPIGPRGVYDEAKRYLEAITTAYKNKFSLDTRIVRIFNSYGPKMRKDDGRAIPNFINQSLSNKDFTLYGDGTQTRSFCYIDDTIEGIYKTLMSNYKQPINIGNPNEYSLIQIIEIINKINPSNSKIKFFELPENDPKMRKPDISLAKRVLNWEPKIDILKGLRKTFNYFNEIN